MSHFLASLHSPHYFLPGTMSVVAVSLVLTEKQPFEKRVLTPFDPVRKRLAPPSLAPPVLI